METLKPILLTFLAIILLILAVYFIKKNQSKSVVDNTINNPSITTEIEMPVVNWTLGTFADEFGDRTTEKFIQTKTEGTFSNSATSNSFLGVELLFTKNKAALFMHEYRDNNPAVHFIGDGTISLKNSNGIVVNGYTGDKWNNSGGIRLVGSTFTKIKNFLLKSTGQVRVHVQDEYSSTYDFIINADEFAEEYKQL